MLLIDCPYCGLRDETEFRYGGEGNIKRPEVPENLNDEQWADYIFMRKNPKGLHIERWYHLSGCRRWFDVERDTKTNEIKKIINIEAYFDLKK